MRGSTFFLLYNKAMQKKRGVHFILSMVAVLGVAWCTSGVFQGQSSGGPSGGSTYRGFPNNKVYAIAVDTASNEVYLGGAFTSLGGFATAGVVRLKGDDRIYVGGQFTQYSLATHNRVVRISTDGFLDSTFLAP